MRFVCVLFTVCIYCVVVVVYCCLNHSVVFWLGDLNYRIPTSENMTAEMVKKLADNFQLPKLLQIDQVRVKEEGG